MTNDKCAVLLLLPLFVAQSLCAEPPLFREQSDVSLSRYQAIGTHNSYHVAPHAFARSVIAMTGKDLASSIDYTHPPLPRQLAMGLRQFELDLFQDERGGKFARPAVLMMARGDAAKGDPVPQPIKDSEGLLMKPGIKILHFPNFDFRTNVLTLAKALKQVSDWSLAHQQHYPVLLLLELKGGKSEWTDEALRSLEADVLKIVPRTRLLTPNDVRGAHATLRAAVQQDGWPLLSKTRGKLILALDNTGPVLDQYLATDPLVRGRLLFPSCRTEQHPSAAWFKINDPVRSWSRIRRLTAAGFMVRTRADADTRQARTKDTKRREKAFSSGAQWISTDFPVPNREFSDYAVQFADGHPYVRQRNDKAGAPK